MINLTEEKCVCIESHFRYNLYKRIDYIKDDEYFFIKNVMVFNNQFIYDENVILIYEKQKDIKNRLENNIIPKEYFEKYFTDDIKYIRKQKLLKLKNLN